MQWRCFERKMQHESPLPPSEVDRCDIIDANIRREAYAKAACPRQAVRPALQAYGPKPEWVA
eukprot:1820678-Alexandrium_andersonii.AAC.1